MGGHFSEDDFFRDIFDGFLKICCYFEAWGVLTMLIVKLRNAVKICDKMTFCAARFSWIKVRHLTDSRFKRVGVFRRMTFLAKSRRNSGRSKYLVPPSGIKNLLTLLVCCVVSIKIIISFRKVLTIYSF